MGSCPIAMQKNTTSIAGNRKTNPNPVKFLIILIRFFIMRANKTVSVGKSNEKKDFLALVSNTSSSSNGALKVS